MTLLTWSVSLIKIAYFSGFKQVSKIFMYLYIYCAFNVHVIIRPEVLSELHVFLLSHANDLLHL